MIVYISGKITGSNNYEIQFEKAEFWLRLKGYKVVNPVKVCKSLVGVFEDKDFYEIDINLLFKCDCIFMLNGWQNSKGAKTELQVAKTLGKKIMYQNYFERNKEEQDVI